MRLVDGGMIDDWMANWEEGCSNSTSRMWIETWYLEPVRFPGLLSSILLVILQVPDFVSNSLAHTVKSLNHSLPRSHSPVILSRVQIRLLLSCINNQRDLFEQVINARKWDSGTDDLGHGVEGSSGSNFSLLFVKPWNKSRPVSLLLLKCKIVARSSLPWWS